MCCTGVRRVDERYEWMNIPQNVQVYHVLHFYRRGAFSPHHWEYLCSLDIRRYRLQPSQVGSRSASPVENGP